MHFGDSFSIDFGARRILRYQFDETDLMGRSGVRYFAAEVSIDMRASIRPKLKKLFPNTMHFFRKPWKPDNGSKTEAENNYGKRSTPGLWKALESPFAVLLWSSWLT